MAPSQPRAALLAAAIVVVPALEAQAPPTVQAGGIFFEPNLGQASPEVMFLARAGSSSVLLGTDGIVFRWRPEASPEPGPPRGRPSTVPEGRVRMTLVGGRLADPVAADRRGSITNYFLGPDRSRWLRGVPNYGRVVYRGVYAGVDLAFHAEQGHVEYDFIVAPGADPAAIELQFDGQTGVRLDGNGDLLLDTPAGQLRQPRPRAYHGDAAGGRTDVAAEFAVQPGGRVGFRLGAVDQGRQLVIDPQVLWSTGTPTNGWKLAASPAGRTYVVANSSQDLVLSGLDVAGQLAWTSYFGGARTERGWDVALGPDGSVYATGDTQSSDLPPPDGFTAGLPPGSPSGTAGGWARKVLLLRFDQSSGDLLFFTWFGGTAGLGVPGNQQMSLDRGSGLAVDPQGYVYVTGSTTSQGFPVQGAVIPGPNPNGVNTVSQGWAAKLDPSMSALVYSTYLRGSTEYEETEPMDVAVDPWGNAHIAGLTDASDFIVSANALDTENDAWDHSGFVTKLGPAGELIYSTYLGGASMDSASGVAMDAQGRACLTGRTSSTDFPRTAGPGLAGGEDTFATRLTVDGTALAYSRTIGGNGHDLGEAIMVGPDDDLFVVGQTYSTDWPTHGSVDQFVVRLSPSGIWQWTLALGGTDGDQAWGGAIDQRGHVYTSGTLLGAGGVVTQIDVCASGLTSSCGPHLEILPTTTRWRALRTRQPEPITVRFVGPDNLGLATGVLDILGPAAGATKQVNGTLQPFSGPDCPAGQGQQCYSLDWPGPWTRDTGPGAAEWLPPGNYGVVVRATIAGTSPPQEVQSERYWRVSLVEVTEVKLEPVPGGAALDENPPVRALVEQGQDPTLALPGGGKRIFAERPSYSGAVQDTVTVTATITPLLVPPGSAGTPETEVPVDFRAFDVDDPATTNPPDKDGDSDGDAADNRGAPASMTPQSVIVATGNGASSILRVGHQPGDNYRVAASTDATWLSQRVRAPNRAHAPTLTYGPLMEDVDPPLNLPERLLPESREASGLLTVWRTLHLEVDSMAPPPEQSAPPETYPERNFLKGALGAFEVKPSDVPAGFFRQHFGIQPEETQPALGLSDGSPEWPSGNGRFEHGRLTIGTEESQVQTTLDGNGTDVGGEFVVGPLFGGVVLPPLTLTFEAWNGASRKTRGSAISWNAHTRVFFLTPGLPAHLTGGQLVVGGATFSIAGIDAADPQRITVGAAGSLPIFLTDDDDDGYPYEVETGAYLSDTDDPALNRLAHAYVRPRRDLEEGSVPFLRNPEPSCGELRQWLLGGRGWPTSPEYWTARFVGALQYAPGRDRDPDDEAGDFGATCCTRIGGPGLACQVWGDGLDSWDSIIFREPLYVEPSRPLACPTSPQQRTHTPLHEMGHAFGLDHGTDGIALGVMNIPLPPDHCAWVWDWFASGQLASMRSRGISEVSVNPVAPMVISALAGLGGGGADATHGQHQLTVTLELSRGPLLTRGVAGLRLVVRNSGKSTARVTIVPEPLYEKSLQLFYRAKGSATYARLTYPIEWRQSVPTHDEYRPLTLEPGASQAYPFALAVNPGRGEFLFPTEGEYEIKAVVHLHGVATPQTLETPPLELRVSAPVGSDAEAGEYWDYRLATLAQIDGTYGGLWFEDELPRALDLLRRYPQSTTAVALLTGIVATGRWESSEHAAEIARLRSGLLVP